jgi:hypothetical protein
MREAPDRGDGDRYTLDREAIALSVDSDLTSLTRSQIVAENLCSFGFGRSLGYDRVIVPVSPLATLRNGFGVCRKSEKRKS